jgi:hypothetical protein
LEWKILLAKLLLGTKNLTSETFIKIQKSCWFDPYQ